MGAGADEQGHRRSGYDFLEFHKALHAGYAKPDQGKHLAHQGKHHQHQALTLFQEAEDQPDNAKRHH